LTGIVVDASVALAWCFPDEASDYAEAVLIALEKRQALVPSIWPIELTNAIVVAERRKRIGHADILRFVELLDGLTIVQSALLVAESVRNVLPFAQEYILSAYDAAYLEVAARHNAVLATLDGGLKKAAKGAGVGLFSA
jgi:predicted nucleic acid-binding protein